MSSSGAAVASRAPFEKTALGECILSKNQRQEPSQPQCAATTANVIQPRHNSAQPRSTSGSRVCNSAASPPEAAGRLASLGERNFTSLSGGQGAAETAHEVQQDGDQGADAGGAAAASLQQPQAHPISPPSPELDEGPVAAVQPSPPQARPISPTSPGMDEGSVAVAMGPVVQPPPPQGRPISPPSPGMDEGPVAAVQPPQPQACPISPTSPGVDEGPVSAATGAAVQPPPPQGRPISPPSPGVDEGPVAAAYRSGMREVDELQNQLFEEEMERLQVTKQCDEEEGELNQKMERLQDASKEMEAWVDTLNTLQVELESVIIRAAHLKEEISCRACQCEEVRGESDSLAEELRSREAHAHELALLLRQLEGDPCYAQSPAHGQAMTTALPPPAATAPTKERRNSMLKIMGFGWGRKATAASASPRESPSSPTSSTWSAGSASLASLGSGEELPLQQQQA